TARPRGAHEHGQGRRAETSEGARVRVEPTGKTTSRTSQVAQERQTAARRRLAADVKASKRSKHIGIRYHHLRRCAADGTIAIMRVSSAENVADICTKPLPRTTYWSCSACRTCEACGEDGDEEPVLGSTVADMDVEQEGSPVKQRRPFFSPVRRFAADPTQNPPVL
ncbi:MAG: hypothetical protein BJ554DRAFT_7521, partial [Olpidium bornovanus]